jgi:hypothetical protein
VGAGVVGKGLVHALAWPGRHAAEPQSRGLLLLLLLTSSSAAGGRRLGAAGQALQQLPWLQLLPPTCLSTPSILMSHGTVPLLRLTLPSEPTVQSSA